MRITAIVFLSLFFGSAMAQSSGTTGMQFLNIGPNAKSLGLSETHTAADLGPSSIFTNPSMLRHVYRNQLLVSHSLWIGDTQNTHAAAVLHRENDSFGFGVLTSIDDELEARTGPGDPSGTFSIRYLSIAGSYARSIGPVSLGATAMYLNEQLYQQNASGYGLNFGASMRTFDERVTFGTALLNVGEMDELADLASELPTSWRLGVNADVIQFSVSESSEIPLLVNFSTDLTVPISDVRISEDDPEISPDDYYVSMALSLEISELITLRGGYRTGNTVRPYSLGMGIKSGVFDFNYAFVPFDTGFGTTHTISLGYSF